MRHRYPMLATYLLVLYGVLGSAAMGQPPETPPQAEEALPQPKPMPDFNLTLTLPTVPTRRGPAGFNETVISASPLPRDKSPQLDYADQTANFTIGQALTGQTSGAVGVILADEDNGSDGSLTLHEVVGNFEKGETISDAQGGTAVAAATQREGVWVLEFAYKPLRMRTVDIEGIGRRTVLYLYYKVVNRTDKPRMFVPQFYLLTDKGQRFPDRVLPQAIEIIRARENPSIPLLGAVSNTGLIPPSTRENVDDAVYGAAVWVLEPEIAHADWLTILVRGLSDGIQVLPGENGQPPSTAYKTLQLDFNRPGDHIDAKEREIRPKDPPFKWTYDSAEASAE